MTYNKQDAQMTKGLGILCMLILHLFCRQGAAVSGTPLLWIDDTTPFVYTLVFCQAYGLADSSVNTELLKKSAENTRQQYKIKMQEIC